MAWLNPTRIAAGVLTALSVLFAVGAFRLGFWIDDTPGPGLLPLFASVLMLPTILLVLREPIPADESRFARDPLIAILIVGAYALMLPTIGFGIATLTLLIVWIRVFYGETWLRALIASAIITAVGIIIFVVLLKVPMLLLPELS